VAQTLETVKIAKRYVKALFSSFTTKTDSNNVTNDMADLGAMIAASPELQKFIETPLLSVDQHVNGIQKLAKKAKFSDIMTNFLTLLAVNRRLHVLPAIVQETENYLAKQSGTVPVLIATARKLSAADQKKITADIKAAIGQEIAVQAYVDESLIGGMVVQVESTLIDGSLKTKLDKLERELAGSQAA
jgi:F-type H+-transporting ATPase subunit delta